MIKLDMVCADPLNRSEWKGRLRDKTFKKHPQENYAILILEDPFVSELQVLEQ